MISKRIILFLMLIPLVSCATLTTNDYQVASSSMIGCSPDEIEVSNIKKINLGSNWTATCRGRVFYCSSRAYSGGESFDVEEKCTEKIE